MKVVGERMKATGMLFRGKSHPNHLLIGAVARPSGRAAVTNTPNYGTLLSCRPRNACGDEWE